MRNKCGSIVLGLLFVLVGVGYVGNAFDLWHFTIFFDGFWALFLVIPAVISIAADGFRFWNTILLFFGLSMLAAHQGFLDVRLVRRLFLPFVMISIGFSILFSRLFFKNRHVENRNFTTNAYQRDISAVFRGCDVTVYNEKLFDTRITAVFGGVRLYLRDAIIEEDVHIFAQCTFGGIEMYVPDDVEIVVSGTPIFGGVSNKNVFRNNSNMAKKIFLSTECVFGGIEIK